VQAPVLGAESVIRRSPLCGKACLIHRNEVEVRALCRGCSQCEAKWRCQRNFWMCQEHAASWCGITEQLQHALMHGHRPLTTPAPPVAQHDCIDAQPSRSPAETASHNVERDDDQAHTAEREQWGPRDERLPEATRQNCAHVLTAHQRKRTNALFVLEDKARTTQLAQSQLDARKLIFAPLLSLNTGMGGRGRLCGGHYLVQLFDLIQIHVTPAAPQSSSVELD